MSYQIFTVEEDGPFQAITTDSTKNIVKFKIWSDDGMFYLEMKSPGTFRITIRYQYSLISSDPDEQQEDELLDRYIIQEKTLNKKDCIDIPICWNWKKGYFSDDKEEDENDDTDYDGLDGIVRKIEIMELIKIIK